MRFQTATTRGEAKCSCERKKCRYKRLRSDCDDRACIHLERNYAQPRNRRPTLKVGVRVIADLFTVMAIHFAAATAMQHVQRPTERARCFYIIYLYSPVPHVTLCPPVVQSCAWHASPQYRAVLHCGQTLKSFRCPTTSHPTFSQ